MRFWKLITSTLKFLKSHYLYKFWICETVIFG